ncbi:MAG: hypothetical protein ACUVTU_10475 [Desulfurispora sp.]|uniref:hypothetical protein n=1 Tax=Desulfurispora sp. TaxID=3014275 RepID=UPI0040499B6F
MESVIFSEIIDEIVQEKLHKIVQEKVKEERQQTAIMLLHEGVDPRIITKATGLNLDEVLQLQKKMLESDKH